MTECVHEWVGITDLEIESIAESCDLWGSDVYEQVIELAASIEKRLKEKNFTKTQRRGIILE